jgi:Flp pilus assembly protein TadG
MSRHSRDDAGSLAVELIVLTPVIFLLAVVVLAFGRVAQARQQVVESARAGAQFAAVLPDAVQAESGAQATASTASRGGGPSCLSSQVITDVSHFYPGGYVTVTVICRVSVADLSVPGMPGSVVVRATSSAPIDPYRSVQ